MTPDFYETPLLQSDSPLDDHSKNSIKEIYAKEKAKVLNLPSDDPLDPKRRARVDYTWTEIQEQPEILTKNLSLERETILEAAEYVAGQEISKIYLVGCGDSFASLLAVRALYEKIFGITCEAVQALDFAYYYNHPIDEQTLVITLSSSGSTVRTVEAMMIARAKGAKTLTFSNTPGSPLINESSRGILIRAERKGWPTQSSTAAMALLFQLGLDVARKSSYDEGVLDTYQNTLDESPKLVQTVLDTINDQILEIAQKEADRWIYLFAGGGPAFASTIIGAAKIKECTPDHAIAIPLEEYHHYNSQKQGDPLLLTVPTGPSIPRALDTAQEGKRWGGQVYSIVSDGNHYLDQASDAVITLPRMNELFSPLVYTVPLQLFAYHSAMEKFYRAGAER
ncbi:MAG: SIS domain-containing protein [Chloroflexota bacterium]|nr:SIS domain-containing protein [Chloroflexota bacterium]